MTDCLSLYKKKTHTDQYLNWQRYHSLHQKLEVICTLFEHAKALTTEEADRQAEMDNIKTALRQCGYPDWAFKSVEKKVQEEKTKKRKKGEKKRMESHHQTGC